MTLPKKEKSTGRHPFLTRWTSDQLREIKRRAERRGIPIQAYLERKVFDLPLDVPTHPAPREKV